MKRLTAIVLMAMVLLSSCKTKDLGGIRTDFEPFRISSQWINLNLNGEFFVVNEGGYNKLFFCDFDSLTSLAVCPRPNCSHNNPEICSAIGVDNHPIAVGDKLFFFEEETFLDKNNRINKNTNIYVAELDGSGRRKIDTLENISIRFFDYIAVSGSTIYFAGVEYGVSDDGLKYSGYDKYYMCSYDFDAKKLKNYGLIFEGYGANALVYGEYRGGLYIVATYMNELLDYTAPDYYDRIIEESIEEVWRFDILTGKLELSELASPQFVGGGYYGYNEDGKAVVMDEEGNTSVYDDFTLSVVIGNPPINGMVFDVYNGTALDIVNGSVLKLNTDIIPERLEIIDYRNGSYIGYAYKDGTTEKVYTKIPEDQIFGNGAEVADGYDWKTVNNHPDSLALQALSAEETDKKIRDDRKRYFELLSPVYPGSESIANYGGGIQYLFSEKGYYCTVYHSDKPFYIGVVIDTDLKADCSADFTFKEVNPDTGEEREVTKSFDNGGEYGIQCLVYPDGGFYIFEYHWEVHFTDIPLWCSMESSADSLVEWIIAERAEADGADSLQTGESE